MIIQKIFSDQEEEELLYSVLMDEEELSLFSEIQKEFNSKSQKALRKVWDLQKGLQSRKSITTKGGPIQVGEVMDKIRSLGRRESRTMHLSNPSVKGINSSINRKGISELNADSSASKFPNSLASKIQRNHGKSYLKAEGFYDTPGKPMRADMKMAKEIMKKSR